MHGCGIAHIGLEGRELLRLGITSPGQAVCSKPTRQRLMFITGRARCLFQIMILTLPGYEVLARYESEVSEKGAHNLGRCQVLMPSSGHFLEKGV